MFLVKGLSSLLFGRGQSQGALIQSSGSFYELHGNHWIAQFDRCSVSVSQSSEQYTYVLSVFKTYGDEAAPAEDSDDAFQFIVQEAMQLNRTTGPKGLAALEFTALEGRRFLFEFDSYANEHTVEMFKTVMCQCQYETKFRRSHEAASDEDLQLLCGPRVAVGTPLRVPGVPAAAPRAPSTPVAGASHSAAAAAATPQPAVRRLDGVQLARVPAELYLFDPQSQQFAHQADVELSINGGAEGRSQFTYVLYVLRRGADGSEQVFFSQDINNDMHLHVNEEHKSIIWMYAADGRVWTWSAKFADPQTDRVLKEALVRALYEQQTQRSYAEVKDEDASFVRAAVLTPEKKPSVEDEADILADQMELVDLDEEAALDAKADSSGEEEEEEEEGPASGNEDDSDEEPVAPAGAKNSFLAVGLKNDRSYVVRGSKIGVFKHGKRSLKYVASIDKLKTPSGQAFSPKKVMLHQQDTSLLMMNPLDAKKIMRVDLHRPDVVQEWKVHDNVALNDLLPQTKYSELGDETTLLGMNTSGFAYLDPRLSGSKMVDSRSFFYQTKPKLSCAATTASGQMVAGSETGELRLFSANTFTTDKPDGGAGSRRAKTQLPGFGDPIMSVDVTADGKWILATCRTYLLLVPAETPGGGLNGFEKRLGGQKPNPMRLQLRHADLQRLGGTVSFTPARFNVSPDQETSIVTSTGPYVITFNFNSIKRGVLTDYQIKQYSETVVGDQFTFGDDRHLVVATPDNVQMAARVVKTFTPFKTPQKR